MIKSSIDLNTIFLGIQLMVKQGSYSLIDSMLSGKNIFDMSQEIMTAYLDATFDEKNKLKNRSKFFNFCKEELTRRGEKISRRLERLQ
jgi:hypothetical protein